MKINSICNSTPSFTHISKQAVDAVRKRAEGYVSLTNSYSADPKFNLMNEDELKKLYNLTLRASRLDNSWIHYEPDSGMVVKFYKDCNPNQSYRFDPKKEGDINSALATLETAVNTAESAEGIEADENVKPKSYWDKNLYDFKPVNFKPERFRTEGENKVLQKIYDNTFQIFFK